VILIERYDSRLLDEGGCLRRAKPIVMIVSEALHRRAVLGHRMASGF